MQRLLNRLREQIRLGRSRGNTLQMLLTAFAALAFVLLSTGIVAFDSLTLGRSHIAALEIGDIAPQDIRAPFDWRYESEVLTERRRQESMDAISPVYDPPDPNVARQQVQLARQVLDYIDNIRRDPFGSPEQKIGDLQQVTALTLDRDQFAYLLTLSDENWRAIDAEAMSVLERVMRQEIRESNLSLVRNQMPTQVSVRFADRDALLIGAMVADLIRTNTFPNPSATEAAYQAAAAATLPESRIFERGQIVVREGARIEPVDYEALAQLGLLQRGNSRTQELARAFAASLMVMVGVGLYLMRFHHDLMRDTQMLALLAALFLISLFGAQLFGGDTQIYIYPSAAFALLVVALTNAHVAFIGMLGLSFLIGLIANNSLEVSSFVMMGGLVGALTLRRAERLNTFFIAGLIVAVTNCVVVIIFNLEMLTTTSGANLGLLLIYSVVNGIFAAAVALAGMYVVTLLFNFPTSLKLVELNQPNQPLLQRLLREAPGTYQHSLQVANLSEQAANEIGANAELVRVASLYHDIGKMLNPAFFVENQADNVNPHDVLNDPVRSADIIISHVTDGDRLARQYRLPSRIRDFILEHHGTTTVGYFYRQALDQAEDAESVDVDQFTYPGPRPQSRETAIMMLADSCESTVRARKPTNKQQISDIVQQIIDARMRDGQLDDSRLTTNDIRTIRMIFVEMLQAVFHPRINYPALPLTGTPTLGGGERQPTHDTAPLTNGDPVAPTVAAAFTASTPPQSMPPVAPKTATSTNEIAVIHVDDDDKPLPEVPPLRRTVPQQDQIDDGIDGE